MAFRWPFVILPLPLYSFSHHFDNPTSFSSFLHATAGSRLRTSLEVDTCGHSVAFCDLTTFLIFVFASF